KQKESRCAGRFSGRTTFFNYRLPITKLPIFIMLIPSIDLMSGKIVQLVQGDKKALDFDDFEYWIDRFSKYPLVQLIDLDAAKGSGDNRHLLSRFIDK